VTAPACFRSFLEGSESVVLLLRCFAAKHVVAGRAVTSYLANMKLAEIEREAMALPEKERASLAAKLLDTLPPEGTDITDEEVERREQELESGQVEAISHEEFALRVQRERGR
jgi:putative addiction module component (TIGR02574 family)